MNLEHLPRFNGTSCPSRWLRRIVREFDAAGLQADRRVPKATTLLDGAALDWLETVWDIRPQNQQLWTDFRATLQQRFASDVNDDAIEDMLRSATRLPGESVRCYSERFVALANRATAPLRLDDYTRYWIRGLGADYAPTVFRKVEKKCAAARLANPNAPVYDKWGWARDAAIDVETGERLYEGPKSSAYAPVREQKQSPTQDIARELLKAITDLMAKGTGKSVDPAMVALNSDGEPYVDDDKDDDFRPSCERNVEEAYVGEEPQPEQSQPPPFTFEQGQRPEGQGAKRRRGERGGKRVRKPRRRPELDREWAEYAASNWTVPLRFLKGRSKREMYSQVILALRDSFGFTSKPRKQKATQRQPPPGPSQQVPPQFPRQGEYWNFPAHPHEQEQQQQQPEMEVESPPPPPPDKEPMAEAQHAAESSAAAAMRTQGTAMKAECKIVGKPVERVFIDPGSTHSLLDVRVAQYLRLNYRQKARGQIELADGSRVTPKGRTQEVAVSIAGLDRHLAFNVVEARGAYDALLGQDWLKSAKAFGDFARGVYTLGNGAVVQQRHKALYQLQPPRRTQPRGRGREGSEEDSDDEELAQLLAALENELAFAKEHDEGDDAFMARSVEDELANVNISPELSVSERNGVKNLLLSYSDCFAASMRDLEVTPVLKFSIELLQGAVPKRCGRSRRLAPIERKFVREQLDELLAAGMIEPFETAATRLGVDPQQCRWLAPITLADKKDGTKRFCVAYVYLNSCTVPDTYALPRADDLIDRLAGAPLYSLVDGFSGYYSVAIDDASILYTAFQTVFGVFVWKVMPFGLKNAPAVYTRLVDAVYDGLDRTGVFIDDLCVAHTGSDSILGDLTRVLDRCRRAKLKLKPKKCYFGYQKLEFLGHVLCRQGVAMADAKVDKIRRMPRPDDRLQLASLLGMYSYYRRFVRGFSAIAAPLTDLLSPKVPFEWTKEAESAFLELKRRSS